MDRSPPWFTIKMMGLVVVGAIGTLIPPVLHREILWLAALGEAFLVAGLLGLTVDPYLKKRLAEETLEATLRAAFGKGLPSAVRQQIRRLASTTIVRRHLHLKIELNAHANEPGFAVATTLMFELVNVSGDPQYFQHVVGLQPTPIVGSGSGVISHVRAECRGETVYDNYDVRPTSVDDAGYRLWQKQILIPPGATARIQTTTREVLPRIWTDVFYIAQATAGATIEIVAPETTDTSVECGYGIGDSTRRPGYSAHRFDDFIFLANSAITVRWAQRANTRAT